MIGISESFMSDLVESMKKEEIEKGGHFSVNQNTDLTNVSAA